MYKVRFGIVGLLLLCMFSGCTTSQQRELKSLKAEWLGGVDTKVVVYDYSGKIIKVYEGRIDISQSLNER